MGRRPGRSRLLALALLAAACGSSSGPGGPLPEFAAPRGRLLGSAEEVRGDVIPYQTLQRGDFRAADPPPQLAAHRDRLGAATCAYVLARPDTKIQVATLRSAAGDTLYRAAPAQLGFRALMDRSCSWWNREQTELPPEYVLEHEQIHFALFELEARRLDGRSNALAREATATAATPEAAAAQSREVVEAALARALAEALRRNREFDADTSMGFRPERQDVWRQRVRRELASTPAQANASAGANTKEATP